MNKQKPIDELTDDDLEAMRLESMQRDAIEPRARGVRYDPDQKSIVIELKSGAILTVPTRLMEGIGHAKPEHLSRVVADGRGYGIFFEDLDQNFSVPGLLAGHFGSAKWMEGLRASGAIGTPQISAAALLGRQGGIKKSSLKAEAARANGKYGGRPKKQRAA